MTSRDDARALEAGLALLRNNQVRSAEAIFAALARETGSAAAWHHLGAARHLLGNLPAAIDAMRHALRGAPGNQEYCCALATVLSQSGQWEEARRLLREGLARAPGHAGLHFNLAVALEQGGADAEALAHYDAAVAAEPAHAGALLNRGASRMRKGEAEAALADFDAILRRDPQSIVALLNRHRALMQLRRDDEALQAARAALRAAPAHAEARECVARALASLGHLAAAGETLKGSGAGWDPLALYLARALERQDACDWRDRQQLVDTLRSLLADPGRLAAVADPGLYVRMLALPFTGEELRVAADAVAAALPLLRVATPLARPERRAKVRIGLFPGVVGHHPDTYLTRRIVRDLDRTRFELRLYALGPDDGSQVRKDFVACADAFTDLSALDPAAIVERVRQDALDVAIDTAAHFKPARPEVFKARLAPVQVGYLAMPAPHGAGLVDYRLSDAEATPAALQPQWSEKLVLLPAPHWTYDDGIAPGPSGTRAGHGLPGHGLVLCGMTQSWKLDPESFAIWMRLLRGAEGSVLWLVDSGPANANLRAFAAAHGVAAERLVFAPRVSLEAHLGRLAHADLFLDPFYFNAQTTAIDALWAGVPLLTCARDSTTSRIVSSFLRHVGLEDLVTRSPGDYEALALRLAREPAALRDCRRRLAERRASAPLFDTRARVRAFEQALLALLA